MCQVGVQRRQHHFREACHFNVAGARRLVGERDATDLDVIFRRHVDLGVRFDRVVAPPVFCAPLHENRFVVIGRAQGRLVRR